MNIPTEEVVCLPNFSIHAAYSSAAKDSAGALVDRLYARKGYTSTLSELPDRLTLIAKFDNNVIGTLTVGFGDELVVESLFPQEVRDIRDKGHIVCEFTKLAIDSSKQVLAALFNVAYIYAYRIREADTLLIEVNPRHVRYYKSMMGFNIIGPEKYNDRVNAVSVLLALDFKYVSEQIVCGSSRRSIYPHAFSKQDESGVLTRLLP